MVSHKGMFRIGGAGSERGEVRGEGAAVTPTRAMTLRRRNHDYTYITIM